MQLIIMGQTLTYSKEKEAIVKMFNDINSIVDENKLLFSHLIVDDITVYDNHFDYINNNLLEIESIIAVTFTREQHIKNLLETSKELSIECKNTGRKLANKLYKTGNNDQWNTFLVYAEKTLQLTDKSTILIKMHIELSERNELKLEWKKYKESIAWIKTAISGFNQAIQHQDAITVADGILHELIPHIEMIEQQIDIIEGLN